MAIVKFWGGLGNQMFQYAFLKALSRNVANVKADLSWYNKNLVHNRFELPHVFGLRLNIAPSFIANIYNASNRKWVFRKIRTLLGLKSTYIEETHPFFFDALLFHNRRSKFFSGYWQNPGYFSEIANDLKKDFIFKSGLSQKNEIILQDVQLSNSVSIHIRRGDYLYDPLLGNLCNKEYYQKAIDLIKSRIVYPKFFIFSDDIDWSLNNLSVEDAIFVSWNTGSSSYIDMQLMSHCKHNIIANSSFSWWAAWLNHNPLKIVIRPKKWTNDPSIDTASLSPSEWLRI